MPKNLLIADDSLTIRKVIGMIFATEDFQVTAVDNGLDAISRTRELRPDVVLADVMMPGKSGYEVCEALKSDPSTQGIPVLLLAGTFEAFDENRAKAARADDHITKPFESQILLDKVKALVGQKSNTMPASAATRVLPQTNAPVAPAGAPPAAAAPPGARPPGAPPPGAVPPGARPPGAGVPPPGARPPGAGVPPPPGAARPLPGAVPPGARPPGAPPPGAMPPGARPPPGAPPPGMGARPPGAPPPGAMPPGARPPPGAPPPGARPPGAPPPGMAARPPGPGAPNIPGGFPRPPGAAPLPSAPPPGAVPPAARARDPFGLGAPAAPPAAQARTESIRIEDSLPEPTGAEEISLDIGGPSPATPPARARPAADGGEALLREALSKASREVIEKIAWEVVPQLAETIIREELERLIKDRETQH
ncbi:response regulator [Corallococcus coralloides DSM 2259]|uniref:Response regulator n=1 Tax=Corallococcus coralloides (strain ATCC 25202 / DSM 2259 / NBRC 100086 / M2) TaxID=1144275 RepID=H8MHV2_CORCM|nr:response regulator [Corallococcus coralloides]AFE09521.1 response regulator [Corallococcus coralloides DSM 2259]